MRSLLLASICLACVACQPAVPPATTPDVGSRPDTGVDAAMDAGSSAPDAATHDSGGPEDTGPDDTGAARDLGVDDTSVPPVDGGLGDAGLIVDSGTGSIDAAVVDAGATVIDPDGGIVSGCISRLHLTGNPLGSTYDWSGCGSAETRTTGAPWADSLVVDDDGVAFFHSATVPSGSVQPVGGTFWLPTMSAPSPFAIVCAGAGSTVSVDGTGRITSFSFQNTTILNTRTNTTGGLAITFGTTTTLSGDVGAHHFAVSADAMTETSLNIPAPNVGSSALITSGSTTISVLYVKNGSALVYALVQVASGSTTDVYEATSGSATSTSITLPATVSFLGSCGGGAGAGSLAGTLSY